jgi:hypothetical protein
MLSINNAARILGFSCWIAGVGLLFSPGTVRADQVIADDLIVQGSLCVGMDCVNNESFDFDTIRLKENNLRIKFDDTSSGAGFAANDWQLTINDSTSGGANKFSIEDITGATIPFTVLAGAPTNSMFLDSTGRLGLRTGTPLLDLHLATGNTPAMRLEQTNGSGFTAQTWDIGANEANFFVRDLTGGSRLPFRIRPGAPTSSVDISASGNVGFGTSSPAAPVHVIKAASSSTAELLAQFSVSDDPVGKLEIGNVSTTDGILHPRFRGTTSAQAVAVTLEGLVTDDLGTNPVLALAGTKLAGGMVVNRPLLVIRNNQTIRARVAANGDVFATSFNPTSSRTMKDNIVDLESEKAQDALQKLTPVEYVYRDDPSAEPRIGFIAEDVPEIVANADRKSVPIMDVVALVTRVVKDQQQAISVQQQTITTQQLTIEDQKKTIGQQQQTLNDLMQRLEALERRMDSQK